MKLSSSTKSRITLIAWTVILLSGCRLQLIQAAEIAPASQGVIISQEAKTMVKGTIPSQSPAEKTDLRESRAEERKVETKNGQEVRKISPLSYRYNPLRSR